MICSQTRSAVEALVVLLDLLLGALTAHRPPQALGLRGGEARECHRHLDHLLLVDDRAERLGEHRLQQRMLVGDLEAGVLPLSFAPLYIRMDRPALDRPRPHQCHLDRQVVEVPRLGPRQHLHLRPRLDLEDAGGLGGADRFVGLGVVQWDPREVDPLAPHLVDLEHAALDRREHAEPEQVDLQEGGVGAGVLVPLDDLAALHRRRDHRAEVDQGLGRDHHAARVLGEVTGESLGFGREFDQRAPARRAGAFLADDGGDELADLLGLAVEAEGAGDPLDLPRRQTERLADLAHRAAWAVGREGGDQGGVIVAVALDHPRDQPLADVAGEVEVDVGHRGRFGVEEPPGEEFGLDGIDVGEAGQVADDRGDARPSSPPRRQDRAGRVGATDLEGDVAGQLEHVAVQEEEAGEVEVADDPELVL